MHLYDFYRQKFPAIVSALENARRTGRIGHAYLLQSDTERVRTEFARVIAQIAACPESCNGKPCLQCRFCRQLESDSYAEYYTLSPVGKMYQIQVGELSGPEPNTVRYFTDRFHYTSSSGAARKIGVILDADRMGVEAQNALLKTLEEPPPETLIILATGNAAALLPTTRSRCQSLMLLENRIEFGFSGCGELLEALRTLVTAGNDFAMIEKSAAAIIDVASGLKADAENKVALEYESRIAAAREFDERLAKRLEKQSESAAAGAYMKERGEFLAAIHSFFAQRCMLSVGAEEAELANPELTASGGLTEPEKAFRQLAVADELLFNLRFNVNESLALRNFAFSAAMAV